MIPFVVAAVAMLAIACAIVLVPLMSQKRREAVGGEASNLSVLRDQRAELETDLANGVLSKDQYEVARLELEGRVLDETRVEGNAPVAPPRRASPWAAVAIAGGFPVLAIALYLVLGTPAALLPALESQSAHAPASPQDIEVLIGRVKERLAAQPDDLEGWTVLARTYYALGRADEAVVAFERATALAPNDADLLADQADAIGITQGRSLEGRPEALIARALAANPAHWKANALAGTLAFKRADYAKAIEHWERVKAGVPPDSPILSTIDASLEQARSLARAGGAPVASASPAPAAKSVAPASRPAVAGTVSIAPGLTASAAPGDTVFVFARPVGGARLPLALVRAQVRDLPLAFTLDDSKAMLPTNKLSDHAKVVVGARVSKSGNAQPQPGDLEGLVEGVDVGTSGLRLVIDKQVP
jgi:cytochrome c-type biogenesis protein CcmH